MKKLPPFWETERMFMRGITEADTDFIVDLRRNPDAYKFFLDPHPLQKQEHMKWFRNKYLNDESQFCYLARLKSDNLPVGVFSAKQISLFEMEMSYILSPMAQGKGLAAEAVAGLEDICRNNSDITVLTAQIHVENVSSIKLIMRLGYLKKERCGDFVIYQKSI